MTNSTTNAMKEHKRRERSDRKHWLRRQEQLEIDRFYEDEADAAQDIEDMDEVRGIMNDPNTEWIDFQDFHESIKEADGVR